MVSLDDMVSRLGLGDKGSELFAPLWDELAKECAPSAPWISLDFMRRWWPDELPPDLAARRKREAEEAGKRYGIERYDVLNNDDCSIMPDYERRVEIVKIIREFQPDFIVTHRID